MSEKIYCKDCRFYDATIGTCHRYPPLPMFDIKNKATGHPFVFDNDWCGMAERREGAKSEFVTVGKVESGDAVCVIASDELENMKEEHKELKVSVQFLVNEMKSFCFGDFHNGKCKKYRPGCYQTCEFLKAIKKYDCLEGDK